MFSTYNDARASTNPPVGNRLSMPDARGKYQLGFAASGP
jgi:hypothetical protein